MQNHKCNEVENAFLVHTLPRYFNAALSDIPIFVTDHPHAFRLYLGD